MGAAEHDFFSNPHVGIAPTPAPSRAGTGWQPLDFSRVPTLDDLNKLTAAQGAGMAIAFINRLERQARLHIEMAKMACLDRFSEEMGQRQRHLDSILRVRREFFDERG